MQQAWDVTYFATSVLPFTLMGALWGLVWMLVWYLVLSLPFRLIIYYTSNYKLAIRCRKVSHWILMLCTLFCAFQLVNIFSFMVNYKSFFSGEFDSYRQMFLPMSFMLMFIIPLYYILSSLLGKLDFFSTEQVPYLRYFILYLRSFKEDNRRNQCERRLMAALRKIYQPYAIGQPNEFMPPRGAKRIYAGDDWQEAVLKMQREAPIILQRVNISEGYLWEFDQCVEHGYLEKVIFWVTDFKQYQTFRKYAKDEYDLDFPELHQLQDEEQVERLLGFSTDAAAKENSAAAGAGTFLTTLGKALKKNKVPQRTGTWILSGVIAAVVGLFSGGISKGSAAASMKTVRTAFDSNDYLVNGSFKVLEGNDVFVDVTTTRVYNPPQQKESSSGGGGGSTYSGGHTSSSGTSHAGSGRKF